MLEALFDRADAGAQAQAAEALPVHPLPDRWESVSPSGAGQDPPEAPGDASVAVLEDTLLHGEVSPSKLAQLWEGATGAILLAFILYYHGLSLEVIGRFFGVHKTTVMRWLSPLAHVNWHGAVQQRSPGCGGLSLLPSIMFPGFLDTWPSCPPTPRLTASSSWCSSKR